MPAGWRRSGLALLTLLAAVMLALTVRELAVSRSLYGANASVRGPLNRMPSPAVGDRVLIFAPHEDDETLGAGGFIQQATAAGADVSVALLTNGEYPEVAVVLTEETLRLSPAAFERLGMARQAETLAALELQGLGPRRVTFLGYPDHALEQMLRPEHWGPDRPVRATRTRATRSPYANAMTPRAVHCGAQLLADLEMLLCHAKPRMVICPDASDVHPDHWATGAFVQYALQELAARGEGFTRDCVLYSYLIHRDHWPAPRGLHPWRALEPPAHLLRVPGVTWRALPLSVAQTVGKRRATALYRTQGGAFDPLLLAFSRANELFADRKALPWPAGPTDAPPLEVSDGSADLNAAALTPGGDITRLALRRVGGRLLVVTLYLRGHSIHGVTYNVMLSAGGARPADRALVHYSWTGGARPGRAQGQVWRDSTLAPIPAERLQPSSVRQQTALMAPWPLNNQGYVLVKAWTTHGRHPVDQMPVTVCTLAQAERRNATPGLGAVTRSSATVHRR